MTNDFNFDDDCVCHETEKHKSVGLAGASLLQLAGSAVEEPFTKSRSPASGTQDSKPSSPERTSSPELKAEMKPTPSPTNATDNWRETRLSQEQLHSVAENEVDGTPPVMVLLPTRRRASFAAPRKEVEPEPAPKRRFTLPSLPSLGSILDDVPKSNLKRPRADSGASRSDGQTCHGSPAPPPAPGGRGSPSATRCLARGAGNSSESDDIPGDGGGSKGVGGNSNSGDSGASPSIRKMPTQESCSDMSDISEHPASSKSLAGAKKLFAEKNFPTWGRGSLDRRGSDQAGYLTTSLSPNWRQSGLGALGRAVSFDEARMAAGRDVVEPPQDAKPRRASAFVVETGILSPVVTEVARRDSAFEPRPTPNRPPITHYSDLLSAGQQFRSITAAPGSVPRHSFPRANPDAEIDGSERSNARGPFRRARKPSTSLWTAPSSSKWAYQSDSLDECPRESHAVPSQAPRLFHVMSPETPFTTGLPVPPNERSSMPTTQAFGLFKNMPAPRQSESGGAGRSPRRTGAMEGPSTGDHMSPCRLKVEDKPGGLEPKARRWSVLGTSTAPMSIGDYPAALGENKSRNEASFGGGVGNMESEEPIRPPIQRRGSMVTAGQSPEGSARVMFGSRRRAWSSLNQAQTPGDEGKTAPTKYASAWGAPSADSQDGSAASCTETEPPPLSSQRRAGSRCRALFGSGSTSGGGEPLQVSSKRQEWSPHKQSSTPSDTAPKEISYVSAWGAPVEEETREADVRDKCTTEGLSSSRERTMSLTGVACNAPSAGGAGTSRRESLLAGSPAGVESPGYMGLSGRPPRPDALVSTSQSRRPLALSSSPWRPQFSSNESPSAMSALPSSSSCDGAGLGSNRMLSQRRFAGGPEEEAGPCAPQQPARRRRGSVQLEVGCVGQGVPGAGGIGSGGTQGAVLPSPFQSERDFRDVNIGVKFGERDMGGSGDSRTGTSDSRGNGNGSHRGGRSLGAWNRGAGGLSWPRVDNGST